MGIFKHLNIGLKLAALISILLVLMLIISWLNIGRMQRIGDELEAIAEVDLPLTKTITEVNIWQLEQGILFEKAHHLAIEADMQRLDTVVAKFSQYARKVNDLLQKARRIAHSAHQRTLPQGQANAIERIETHIDVILEKYGNYEEHTGQVFDRLRKRDTAAADLLHHRVEKEEEELHQELHQFLMSIEDFTEASTLAARDHENVAVKQAQAITGISLLFGIITSTLLIQSITRPLGVLSAATRNVAKGDFDVVLDIDYRDGRDEIGRLAEAFLTMTRTLKAYIDKLARTTAARERIESELNIARDIQLGILRRSFNEIKKHRALDIFATVEPAREVGGDLYDFRLVEDNRLFFAIGDVSGKGIAASLFMAVTATLIKAVARSIEDPGRMLKLVNDELSEDNEACMFVTLFCGVLNTETGEVLYANGGHNPPLLLHRDGNCDFIEVKSGVSLGVMKGADFETQKLYLEREDSLFLYTDGVTEAMNESEELFSDVRLKEILEDKQQMNMKSMVLKVMSEIKDFSKGQRQSDDITMLALRYTAARLT
ncbi:MAG: SpoIIE family protein phosphatase [bacterium]|nr:SpoIIE family protein phosphatase [bacterium]